MSLLLVIFSALVLIIAYVTYGGYVARKLGIDDRNETPAHTMKDGVDYVPAKTPVLLGHHFASIAGAGPIVGPVIAAAFGWVPVFLWLLIGGIFIGAVHDFSSMVASIRHRGQSIGEIIEEHIGLSGKRLFLTFSWSALVLVVAVFALIIADTFIRVPAAATASLLFIVLAVAFGLTANKARLPLWMLSIIGAVLLFFCIYLGDLFPLVLSADPAVAFQWWTAILMGYIFVASVTPVWILLQPRDYLNSFLLYGMMIGGILGLIFAGAELNLAPVTTLNVEKLGPIFPILFVTVACGAISGFHSLVASGTTAKQVDRETDTKKVGYGAMLIEVLLAVLALVAVASLASGRFTDLYDNGGYVTAFSEGIGGFIAAIPFLNLDPKIGTGFVALVVSAFALTSLDTCCRLARYAFQEFFQNRKAGTTRVSVLSSNRFIGTAITVAAGWGLLETGKASALWPIFGSANQLLAALALLAVSVWLAQKGRSNTFVKIPMYFMFSVTLAALGILIYTNALAGNYLVAVFAVLLFALAIILAVQAYKYLAVKPAVIADSGAAD